MPLPPPIAAIAPEAEELTAYDIQHLVTYLRLLDADAEGAGWKEMAGTVLALDPEKIDAKRILLSHLSRAKWMAEIGYRLL